MKLIEQIKELKENTFTSSIQNVNIDSIMLYDKNEIQTHFYKEDGLHEMRSISKVLIALAYGIAIDKKMKVFNDELSVNTFVYPIIKDLVKIKKENIDKIKKWTVKTLLTYSAGYENQMFSERFIKDINEKDYLSYVLNYELQNQPNKKYIYNNAELFILSVFFQEAFKINIKDFICDEIFKPLNITKFIWKDYDKYCPGGTGLYISHHDLFKIGQLILQKGTYEQKQIVSSEYIEAMCSCQIETPYAVKPERVLPKQAVGYIMHISRNGYVYKDGTNGQYLIVNFNKQQLITILSSEPEMSKVTEILRNLI